MLKNNLIYVYIALVGLPAVGIVTVLTTGSKLVAPIGLSGSWNVQVDASSLPQSTCGPLFKGIEQVTMNIAQSGPNFAATWNDSRKTVLSGAIRDNQLLMGTTAPTVACNQDQFRVAATVTGPLASRSMEGSLFANWCATCPPVPFKATLATARRGH
ncbi:MAG: hypothetical protein ABI693_15640 [Bryobacteraceae bacterium]